MTKPTGVRLAEAADGLVGAPFRFRGRDAATGLDCLGVCLLALRSIGRAPPRISGYTLRNSSIDHYFLVAQEAQLEEVEGMPIAGDLLLLRLSPVQHHLVIAAIGGNFIHAHAGLRRVVKGPLPTSSEIVRHWRITP